MVLLAGDNWSGNLHLTSTTKASGRINNYAWYFQSKADSWILEIADDQSLEASDLPLVGYGCGGWLYESGKVTLPHNEAALITYLNTHLTGVFLQFQKNTLNYLPAVSCPCSDES